MLTLLRPSDPDWMALGEIAHPADMPVDPAC